MSVGTLQSRVLVGTVDPTAGVGVAARLAALYERDKAGVGELWQKTGAADTAWFRRVPPNVIYAERNTAVGTDASVDYDAFYDAAQAGLAGAALTTALAAIGLTYAAGVFTAVTAGLYHFGIDVVPIAASALQTSSIGFTTSAMPSLPTVAWFNGDPNPAGGTAKSDVSPQATVYLRAGDTISLAASRSGTVTVNVAAYVLVWIARLV